MYLPFKHQAELEGVDMVHLLYLYDVNDRHRHIDVDRDVQVVHFVKTERGYFLVVIILGKMRMLLCFVKTKTLTFRKRSLQLSSSDSSKQFEV